MTGLPDDVLRRLADRYHDLAPHGGMMWASGYRTAIADLLDLDPVVFAAWVEEHRTPDGDR